MPTTHRILIVLNILYSLVLRFYEEHTLFYLGVQLEVFVLFFFKYYLGEW